MEGRGFIAWEDLDRDDLFFVAGKYRSDETSISEDDSYDINSEATYDKV